MDAAGAKFSDKGDVGHVVLNATLTFGQYFVEGLSPVALGFGVADFAVGFYKYAPRYYGPVGKEQAGWRAVYYNGADRLIEVQNELEHAYQDVSNYSWQHGSGHGI